MPPGRDEKTSDTPVVRSHNHRKSSIASPIAAPKVPCPPQASGPPSDDAISVASPKQETLTKGWKTIGDGFVLTDQVLGRGSFGVVSLGYQGKEKVAVKSVSKTADKKKLVAFTKEMEMLQYVGNAHPNLIHLLSLCEDEEMMYAVLPFRSCDLYSYIERSRRLSEPVAMKIMAQLVEGVAYLHSRGVAHRDIKLENILLDEDTLEVQLADFGFATLYDRPAGEKLNKWCGSPYSVAPEIIAHIPYDAEKVDVWALGTVLYTMLCGQFPFQTDTIDQVLRKTKAYNMNAFHHSVGASSKDLIMTMMTYAPEKRSSFDQLKQHPWMRLATATKNRKISPRKSSSSADAKKVEQQPQKSTATPIKPTSEHRAKQSSVKNR